MNETLSITPEQVRRMLSERGLRCTRQREAVYAALAACDSHPTAEELFRLVQDVESGVSLATIYNTVEAFARVGLCRKLAPGSASAGACRYDADMSDHVHLVDCEGGVIDVPEDLAHSLLQSIPQSLLDEVERRTGVTVSRVNLELVSGE